MKYLILFIVFSITIKSFSQEGLKKIKNENTEESYIEEFYVLKSDKSIKQGKYLKKSTRGILFNMGQFSNGKKSGIWNFYDYYGGVELKYDFDSNKVVEFNVKNAKKDTVNNFDTPAIMLKSSAELVMKIAKITIYPEFAKENGIQGKVFVSVKINKDGIPIEYYIDRGIHESLDEESLRVVKEVTKDIKYIPATKDGNFVESLYFIPISFRLS